MGNRGIDVGLGGINPIKVASVNNRGIGVWFGVESDRYSFKD